MTYQECIWKDTIVWVVGILSKSGKIHRYVKQYVGRGGFVLGESKNGMLLIKFSNHTRCIPAGCIVKYGTVSHAGNLMGRK